MKEDLKILLVEQNGHHVDLIVRELSEKYPSSSILVFDAAHTALEELRREVPDIAIIGLDLPDVDGLGFIQLIRKENRSLPIVAIGDANTEQVAAEAAEAGVDEYLTKNGFFHVILPDVLGKLYSRLSADAQRRCSDAELKQEEQAALIRVTASTLYHEVNNPLMTILGATELILNNGHECDPEITKKTRVIRKSAQKIQSTLIKLSTISQPTIKETPTGKLIDPQKSISLPNLEP